MHTATRQRIPWALAIPFLLVVLVFWMIPLIGSFIQSIQSDGLGATRWVGATNYTALFSDERYHHALRNTAVYAIGSITIILPLSLLLAHLLQRCSNAFRNTVTVGLLLPALTPPLILTFLFIQIFAGSHGILNNLLSIFGGETHIDWLKDPDHIMQSMIIQSTWRWTGFVTLFLLAALKSIPRMYLDAAKIEGSSSLNTLLNITLPFLKSILLFVALFLMLDAFVLFEGAYYLLGGSGGTSDAGLLLVAYTYHQGYGLFHFGTAAAISFTTAPFLLLLLGGVMLRWGKRA